MPRRAVASDGRRRAINTKITDEIRTKLETAAGVSGRTISHEIEHRLEESFLRAKASPEAQYLGDAVALSATFSAGITAVSPLKPNFAARRYTLVRATMTLAHVLGLKPIDQLVDEKEREDALLAETFAKEDEATYRASHKRWDEALGGLAKLFKDIEVAPPDRSQLGNDHASTTTRHRTAAPPVDSID